MTTATLRQKSYRSNTAFALLAAAAIAATAAASWPTIARADEPAAPSVKIRYSDLDLSTDIGTATLYRRIARAAQQVCPDAHSRDLGEVAFAEKCQADAITAAVRAVNSPQLALVHASRTNHG